MQTLKTNMNTVAKSLNHWTVALEITHMLSYLIIWFALTDQIRSDFSYKQLFSSHASTLFTF